MKVYVIYDPLEEKVLCVHQYPNVECLICKPIRKERNENKDNYYFLEETEHVVFNNAKTYDSPAVLGANDIVEETNELIDKLETVKNSHREENIVSADEEDQQPEMKYYNPKSGKMEKLFDESKLKKGKKL